MVSRKLLLLAAVLLAQSALGADAPLVIGGTFTVDSKVLGETRRINVYLPPGYQAAPEARVPVLYMPDGGMAEDLPPRRAESLPRGVPAVT